MKENTQEMDMRDAFPVFKFNYNGKLLDCNSTALPLLGHWHCKKGAKLPTGLMKACPEIKSAMKNPQPAEIKMQFGEYHLWCDVVPYPEAGYIGIYGFHVEAMMPEQQNVKLRMAS